MFFLGTVIAFWLLGTKIYKIYVHEAYRNVTENPLFFLALVAIMVGSQLFLAGFLGELFVKQSISKSGDYLISEKAGQ